jgi:putative salt-induced outer membrane protein YdiY
VIRNLIGRAAVLRAAAMGALVMAGLAAGGARADEILFNNGDRLSGTVQSVEGGKMKFKTDVAGEITVDLKDVKTFTTDKPVEFRTKSDEVITAPAVGADEPGVVTVQPAAEGEAAREVRLDDVKYVNFDQTWTGSVVAGALFARGNTYADQANVSAEAIRRTIDDRITLNGSYNFGRQEEPDTGDKITTVDNWYAAGKYDYFFTEKVYGFASLRYERDRIAELDRRVIPGVGVGYLWFDEADFKFDTEAGLAFVHERFEDGDTNDSMSARLAYHLKKDLWDDKVGLFHNLEYYPSLERLDDFLVIADAGVRAAMTERMFAEYKIEYRYDATPAEGLHKTDLRHIVGVGWRF